MSQSVFTCLGLWSQSSRDQWVSMVDIIIRNCEDSFVWAADWDHIHVQNWPCPSLATALWRAGPHGVRVGRVDSGSGLTRASPVPHQLQPSGEQALPLPWTAQQSWPWWWEHR